MTQATRAFLKKGDFIKNHKKQLFIIFQIKKSRKPTMSDVIDLTTEEKTEKKTETEEKAQLQRIYELLGDVFKTEDTMNEAGAIQLIYDYTTSDCFVNGQRVVNYHSEDADKAEASLRELREIYLKSGEKKANKRPKIE